MRFSATLLALLCVSCANRPTAKEQALIAQVESRVTLPPGGGKLQCYERHYALLRGKEVQEVVGPLKINELLVGYYIPSDKPGIRWADSAKELPQIADAGCHLIKVFYVIGEKKPEAWCSPTMAGVSPSKVEPPVTC